MNTPTPAEILEGATVAPWLRARVDALADSAWPLDHVATIGAIHRFWLPEGMAAKIAMLQGHNPAVRVRIDRWVRSLTDDDWTEIRRLTAIEIGNLRQFVAEHLDSDSDSTAVAAHMADRRDALESVLRVLLQIDEARHTRALLATLDAHIVTLWSQLPPAGTLSGSEFLQQAHIHQPDAWWTAFAE